MRKNIFVYAAVAVLSIASARAQEGRAGGNGGGGREGGGGQVIAGMAADLGRHLWQTLEVNPRPPLDPFSDLDLGEIVPKLRNAVERVSLQFLPNLCRIHVNLTTGGSQMLCPDAEYDARQDQIRISEAVWHSQPCMDLAFLLAHEYARAAGIEGGSYHFSARYRRNAETQALCRYFDSERNFRGKP